METSKKAQTEARPTISSVSPVLRWEVFVTPGIPIRTVDRPAGLTETVFQAMASTLIYGEKDSVLVDTFMTAKQANDLANWVEAKGKNLRFFADCAAKKWPLRGSRSESSRKPEFDAGRATCLTARHGRLVE